MIDAKKTNDYESERNRNLSQENAALKAKLFFLKEKVRTVFN
jgi:hypothetical protein